MNFFLCGLLFFGVCGCLAAEWRMQHSNFADILMGVDFTSVSDGWVGGANDGTGIHIYIYLYKKEIFFFKKKFKKNKNLK